MSRLTKTLESLLERAERKGYATKNVRELSIMGRGYHASPEDVRRSPMVEQWGVTHETSGDGERTEISVHHYGTLIFCCRRDNGTGHTELTYWYGESNTDRDALNGLCAHFGITGTGFSYRPSTGDFICTTYKGVTVI